MEPYTIKIDHGVVQLYTKNGQLDRVVCLGAVAAVIKEKEIIVSMKDNKKKVFTMRGYYKGNG